MNLGCPLCNCLSTYSIIFGFRAFSGCPLCRVFVIFHTLLEFFIESLSVQAIKTITLGGPLLSSSPTQVTNFDGASNGMGSLGGQIVGPVDHGTPYGGSGLEGSVSSAPVSAPQERRPKKMVSISENVEEIGTSSKKWKKDVEKRPSMEGGKEEVKPLKSILKVGSISNIVNEKQS